MQSQLRRAALAIVGLSLAAVALAAAPSSSPVTSPDPPSAPPLAAARVPVVKEFMQANRVDGILDAWLVAIHGQWDEQVKYMKVKPPPGFWDESLREFDMESQRRELAATIGAGLTDEAMKQDVAWLKSSGVGALSIRIDAMHEATEPAQAGLFDEVGRAAARHAPASSGPVAPPPRAAAPVKPPPPPAVSPAELQQVHRLMEALGYGAPDVLAGRLIESLKQSLPDAPPATWTDAQLVAAAGVAAKQIEAAFLKTWTPAEAKAMADALATPEAKRHDDLMNRMTALVMTRSDPFAKAVQKHVLKRYSKIFSAAWEQHLKETPPR